MLETIVAKLKRTYSNILLTFQLIGFSMTSGIVTGIIGALFCFCLQNAVKSFSEKPQLIFLLPFGGLLIVFLYHALHEEKDRGTNTIIASIHSNAEVKLKLTPLIFLSTVITHLFGGSAGREGAALQLGGSIGNFLGKIMCKDDRSRHIMIMCSMSGAFAALFGTPMTASIFAIEVISVGIMHYSALVPCVISALTASAIARTLGISPEHFTVSEIPEFTILPAAKTVLLAMLCAAVSIIFCISMHKSSKLFHNKIKNQYLRIFIGGVLVVILTVLVGTNDYNCVGMDIIEHATMGKAVWYAFIMKILFTAITLGSGYRGGEIVPSFFIGATFGCTMAQLLGLSPGLGAAIGMIGVFCGVTNCPISSLLMSFELFGFDAMPYFLLTIAISYLLSGYYGLYSSQRIIYSKYTPEFINKTAK